jgi:hypothetical protein
VWTMWRLRSSIVYVMIVFVCYWIKVKNSKFMGTFYMIWRLSFGSTNTCQVLTNWLPIWNNKQIGDINPTWHPQLAPFNATSDLGVFAEHVLVWLENKSHWSHNSHLKRKDLAQMSINVRLPVGHCFKTNLDKVYCTGNNKNTLLC